MRARVTMKDIGARVGISAAAVSMALAGSSRISEVTRVAVREAAHDLGYVPSSAGRALRSRRSDVIALIVPQSSAHVFGHLYFMHILTGMTTTANNRGAQVIVSTGADPDGSGAYERVMRSGMADGAIVTSAALADDRVNGLVASGLPVVLIGNYPRMPGAVSVGIDDQHASEQITRHLTEVHGRSRLLHVSGPLDHQAGLDRRDGFLRGAQGGASVAGVAGVAGVADVVEGDFSDEGGAAAIAAVLANTVLNASPFPYDGIVFANDDMAVGGLRELERAGIGVPQEVSVVGFDDFGLARVVSPGLTTVRAPAEEMASVATGLLLDLVDGAETVPHTQLRFELVVRRSCGCTSPVASQHG